MKPKVKKELRQNVLAEAIGTAWLKVRPYTNYVLGGLLVLMAVYLFLKFQSGRAAARTETAWANLSERLLLETRRTSPEKLGETATNFPEAPAAGLALLAQGGALYQEAVRLFRTAPAEAHVYLQKAEDAFRRVVERYGGIGLARPMAELGLAYVSETRGDLAEARRRFQQVIAAYPETAAAEAAADRLRALSEPDAAAFYAAAATQARTAATRAASDSQPDARRPTPAPRP